MKKLCLFLIVCVLIIPVVPITHGTEATESMSDVSAFSCRTLDGTQGFLGSEPLPDKVHSVILYEKNSQTLMYQWNADQRIDPASLVKIMTAMIVIENSSLTDVVTVTQNDLDLVPYASATVELQEGEVLTVEQLLYCMLVGSANDASIVLANHVSGNETAFVDLMNQCSEKLGCTNTNFKNVHGMYDVDQYTTARDIAKILDTALNNDTFRTIFGTSHYNVPTTSKSASRYLSTGNFLMNTDVLGLYYDERVTGGRTGITDDGLRNLASVAQKDDMELICIVLGAESVIADDGYSTLVYGGYDETSALLSKGFQGMSIMQVTWAGQILYQQSVVDGECDVVLGAAESIYAILPDSTMLTELSYRYPKNIEFRAPIKINDTVSTVEIWYENICVAETQLIALNNVNKLQPADTQVSDQPEEHSLLLVIVIIAVVMIGCIILLRTLSRAVRHRRYTRSRQYRRNRKRSR